MSKPPNTRFARRGEIGMRILPTGSRWIRAELRFALHGQMILAMGHASPSPLPKLLVSRGVGMKCNLDPLADPGLNASPVGHWQRDSCRSCWLCGSRALDQDQGGLGLPRYSWPGCQVALCCSQHLPMLQFPQVPTISLFPPFSCHVCKLFSMVHP